jgi:hypothetical protein
MREIICENKAINQVFIYLFLFIRLKKLLVSSEHRASKDRMADPVGRAI